MTHEPPASVELAPCPFCGGDAQEAAIGFGVRCNGCGAEVSESDPQRAVLLWNTRTSTPPARPGREDLIRIIKAEVQKHGANAGVRSGGIAMDAASQILAIFDGAGA